METDLASAKSGQINAKKPQNRAIFPDFKGNFLSIYSMISIG